ncbi:MAG: hypothetical protein M1820_004922 [Bogoriella megaspora]|nr:MAG: hypothetical protein M1820_004922 [Bogoriella megaspora]
MAVGTIQWAENYGEVSDVRIALRGRVIPTTYHRHGVDSLYSVDYEARRTGTTFLGSNTFDTQPPPDKCDLFCLLISGHDHDAAGLPLRPTQRQGSIHRRIGYLEIYTFVTVRSGPNPDGRDPFWKTEPQVLYIE